MLTDQELAAIYLHSMLLSCLTVDCLIRLPVRAISTPCNLKQRIPIELTCVGQAINIASYLGLPFLHSLAVCVPRAFRITGFQSGHAPRLSRCRSSQNAYPIKKTVSRWTSASHGTALIMAPCEKYLNAGVSLPEHHSLHRERLRELLLSLVSVQAV